MNVNCVESTIAGRCPQPQVEVSVVPEQHSSRCYYHDKVFHGFTSSADVLTPIDDGDGDDY